MTSTNGNHQGGDLTHLRSHSSGGSTRGGSATAPRAADHTRQVRALLNGRLWLAVDQEPADVVTDSDRLLRLQAHLGGAAIAYEHATSDIDDEIYKLAVTALAWLDAHAREAD